MPTGSDHRLQVIDDWLGKSRTVVYDDGDIGTPPTGTFDASISIEEAQTSDDTTADAAASQSSNAAGSNEGSTGGFFAPYQPPQTADSNQSSDQGTTGGFFAPYQPLHTADSPNASDYGQSEPAKANDPAGHSLLLDDLSGTGLNALSVKDLRDRLKSLGLPTSGRKSELVDRLASEKGSE